LHRFSPIEELKNEGLSEPADHDVSKVVAAWTAEFRSLVHGSSSNRGEAASGNGLFSSLWSDCWIAPSSLVNSGSWVTTSMCSPSAKAAMEMLAWPELGSFGAPKLFLARCCQSKRQTKERATSTIAVVAIHRCDGLSAVRRSQRRTCQRRGSCISLSTPARTCCTSLAEAKRRLGFFSSSRSITLANSSGT